MHRVCVYVSVCGMCTRMGYMYICVPVVCMASVCVMNAYVYGMCGGVCLCSVVCMCLCLCVYV